MDVPVTRTSRWRKLRNASPWWLICLMPFSAIATSATLAPRVEIYTLLACKVHLPNIHDQDFSLVPENTVNWRHAVSETLPPRLSSSSDINIRWTRESGTKILTVGENRCASDPVVQAATAKLIAIIAASTGILSCLTGAWWGAFSDRHGRTKVLGITIIGAIVTDLNLILVAHFPDKLPGGYWFLIIGPLIEGLLGGLASGSAATHAYIADTTTEEARSHMFSLNLGLFFAGIALGPLIGSLLIKSTGQVLSVFFLAASMHLAYALLIWLVVPESLTKERMETSRRNDEEYDLYNHFFKSLATRSKKFLEPLAIFVPVRNNNLLKKGNKDWSLTFIALIYGLIYLLLGSISYTYQYLTSSFNWSSETLGYYIGVVGSIRTIHLMVVIPGLIKFLRSKAPSTVRPSDEEPLLSTRNTLPTGTGAEPKNLHSPSLDMNLARISLVVEVVAYVSMGLSRNGLVFSSSAVLLAMGSGISPALQSLALTIFTKNGGTETGKLFGALSVVLALCSQIIGPSMFGVVYAKTVAWFPQSIFFVSMIIVSISFTLLCFVRLPKVAPQNEVANAETEPSTIEEE